MERGSARSCVSIRAGLSLHRRRDALCHSEPLRRRIPESFFYDAALTSCHHPDSPSSDSALNDTKKDFALNGTRKRALMFVDSCWPFFASSSRRLVSFRAAAAKNPGVFLLRRSTHFL